MATQLVMPKLTQTMEEGTLVEWLKQPGDKVRRGDPLYVVETDKASVDVESPAEGVMGPTLVSNGARVPVGQMIGSVLEPGEQAPPAPAAPQEAARPAPAAMAEVPAAPAAPAPPTEERLRVSPVARKLADEQGIDLSTIQGTGPGGRIVREDVERAIEERKAAPAAPAPAPTAPPPTAPAAPPVAPGTVEPLSPMRRAIAEAMAQSNRTVPRVTEFVEVDATELVRLRESLLNEVEKRAGVRLSYTHILVKLVARAMELHPAINAQWADGGIRRMGDVNVGIAVALPDGLIVVTLRNANTKGLAQIAAEASRIADQARQKRLSAEAMSGATFTISNLGMYEIDGFTPIVNLPEAGILGVGRIVEKPWVHKGEIIIRSTMVLSLSFDHRVLDGAQAAEFLQTIKHLVETPGLFLV